MEYNYNRKNQQIYLATVPEQLLAEQCETMSGAEMAKAHLVSAGYLYKELKARGLKAKRKAFQKEKFKPGKETAVSKDGFENPLIHVSIVGLQSESVLVNRYQQYITAV